MHLYFFLIWTQLIVTWTSRLVVGANNDNCCNYNFQDININDERIANVSDLNSFVLLEEGSYHVPELRLCNDGNVTRIYVAVQMNSEAQKSFLENSTDYVNGSLRLGFYLSERQHYHRIENNLYNFTINTTNITIVNIDIDEELSSGSELLFTVSMKGNVGIAAVSQSPDPKETLTLVTADFDEDGRKINLNIEPVRMSWSPMITPVIHSQQIDTCSKLKTPQDLDPAVIAAVIFAIAFFCFAVTVVCLLVFKKLRTRRRKGSYWSTREAHIEESSRLNISVSQQHNAVRTLVSGNDYEDIEILSHPVDEKEQTYVTPPSEMCLLHNMLQNNHCLEIPRQLVSFETAVGHGNFGTVCKGRLATNIGNIVVAVKMIGKDARAEDKVAILQEAAIMGQFRNPNVVWLFGIIAIGDPIMLVLEFMENGDLKNYLLTIQLNHEDLDNSVPQRLLNFCCQIAQGMSYLTEKLFVHRDLAARNVLLDSEYTCKISDFGLSREVSNSDYYTTGGGQVPVKWTPPEALKYGKYSPSSDVWSYGMVLFEIWSLGSSPYPTMTSEKVFKWLTSLSEDHDDGDYIQYPPPGCPRFMYSMMVKCWRFDHHSRPTFGEIVAMLSGANECELTVSDANVENSELAAHLGAPLGSAVGLYSDLRHSQ